MLKSFETPRLLLKPTSTEDARLLIELYNSPKWLEHIGDRNIKTEMQAAQYITEKMLPQQEKLGFGNYTIIKKLTGEKMGVCGLYDRKGLDGVDLGYAILPQFEKQGFVTESAARIVQAGFEDFNLDKIQAITNLVNTASQSILEKIGFTYLKNIFLPDDPEELRLYVLNKNEG